ncbi:MAG TPA: monooxygenase, partial [Candidatus Kapabacteria bacterium]
NADEVSQFGSYDLIVGADGVMSGVRAELADLFKPELSTRTNRYIWFGTPHLFHGLTLTFRENSAGVFAAHSYKFNRELSTFIVECDEETWDSAGFRDMDDDATRRYIEQVFHLDLQGSPLLSNNSKWINFVMVRNRNWWSTIPKTNACATLLGDSLATAHFSIGSGTKLALEDAIALVHALKAEGTVPDALREFEAARRPIVEEYQEAAWESLQFFENLKDYMHFDPLPFAYKLMTRSGKVDYENLKRRDANFVNRYEEFTA